jgi:hypothetical protein
MNPTSVVDAVADGDLAALPLERLEAEISGWNAQLSAATCRWLLLVGEFDRRRGWEAWECHSCAHYLDWMCGIDRRTAREHVRVARSLEDLPLTRVAFARGELSYAKVRAITRVATGETEASLVEWARHGTASHLEEIVRGFRRVKRLLELEETNQRHANRYARWRWNDDGSLAFSARLDPEAGAQLIAAIEGMTAIVGGSAEPASVEESPEARRADALVALAEAAVAGGAEGLAAHVPEVVVHVDVAVLSDDADGDCLLDDGPALAPETARRLACEAGIVTIIEDADGNPLNIGRRHRRPPTAMRRALAARDGSCRFPGCGSRRFLHAHHVVHWARGGKTSVRTMALLCSKHHRAVHEGGYTCRLVSEHGELSFLRPDGRPIERPPTDQASNTFTEPPADDAGRSLWSGEHLDLGLAVEGLCLLDANWERRPA